MSINRTRLKSRILDRLRVRNLGQDATLDLLSYEQGAGESVLLTVTDGWAEQPPGKDQSTSTLNVTIAAQDTVTDAIMNEVARFTVGSMTYRVVNGGITPPLGEPRSWSIVGEEIRPNV